jgi:uncharacterized cofD-like protein
MNRLFTFDFLKWFYPGMHIKRWLGLMVIGVAIMAFGFSYLVREAYLEGLRLPDYMYYLTLQFIPRYIRGAMFMGGAIGLIVFSIMKLNQSLLSVLAPNRDSSESLVNTIYTRRFLGRGPKIVAIGGGTGLSTLLRGLKEYTTNLTAIVTVADDGGSSGVLRRELGVLPPGDVRNCIAALADAEPLVTKLFQYRFDEDSGGLAGHSFGNIFIVAMSGVVGNFEDAIRQTSRVLAVRGQIIPSTLDDVTLSAHTTDQRTIDGESNITHDLKRNGHDTRINEVYLTPHNPPAHPEAVRAILDADLIILGPGSLYTSVMPNMLVQGIRRAISASSAPKIYACNVATQHGETDGFSVRDHVAAIESHIGTGILHYVLANDNLTEEALRAEHSVPVAVDADINHGLRLVKADVVSEENRYHHDSVKLARAVMEIYYEHDSGNVPEREESLVSALD